MRAVRLLVLGCACAAFGPAGARADLRLLETGYTAALVGTEWAYPAEQYAAGGPQADGAGNLYQVGGTFGRLIVRESAGRVTHFAEVTGTGQPHILGLWFDQTNAMIVVVERAARVQTPAPFDSAEAVRLTSSAEHGTANQRVYYRIKGFPALGRVTTGSAPPQSGVAGGDVLDALPQTLALVFGLLACTATVILRQVQRDFRRARRSG